MTESELDALQALAEVATNGPWHYDQMQETIYNESGHPVADVDRWNGSDQDGFYIAAVDPETVLHLINELRTSRAEAKALRARIPSI